MRHRRSRVGDPHLGDVGGQLEFALAGDRDRARLDRRGSVGVTIDRLAGIGEEQRSRRRLAAVVCEPGYLDLTVTDDLVDIRAREQLAKRHRERF